ncbi:HD domain-containing protein [Candidatus Gracilibacteria bacterium]|nr:HD domain-containing protein [Candidatus Gracilibacteria bacterium]
MPFRNLEKNIKKKADFDLERIKKAYELAYEVHKEVKRKSGEMYIFHPLEVAQIILEIGGDENMICAALLHDVLEDGHDEKYLGDKICEKFGSDVFFLVQAMSKDGRIKNKDEKQNEYCERMEESLHLDSAVFFLKMADMIHNMQTISGLEPKKRKDWLHRLQNKYMPMLSRNFHHVSLYHQNIYLNLMNKLESVIEEYAKQKITT